MTNQQKRQTKRKVSTVKMGVLEFQGLMNPENNNFEISVPQIADLFKVSLNHNTASRDLKRTLEEDFRPSKVAVESYNQLINTIDLEQFRKVILKFSYKGDPNAQLMNAILIGVSLEEFFNDAFSIPELERDSVSLGIQKEVLNNLYQTDTEKSDYSQGEQKQAKVYKEEIESLKEKLKVYKEELNYIYTLTGVINALTVMRNEQTIDIETFAKSFIPYLKSGYKPPRNFEIFVNNRSKKKYDLSQLGGRNKLYAYLLYKGWCTKGKFGNFKASSSAVKRGLATDVVNSKTNNKQLVPHIQLTLHGCARLVKILEKDGYFINSVPQDMSWKSRRLG